MTRSVSDSALVLQAIAGYDPLDPSTVPVPVPDFSEFLGRGLSGLKMGVPSDYYFDMLDP
jgi:aspartyl-tRNA(Asn)/glutamyl-tRNA(Gln) amidotransferase subunit A